MELLIVGLGKMGLNMAKRLLRAGVAVRGVDPAPEARATLEGEGGKAFDGLEAALANWEGPRVVWLMVPLGAVAPSVATLKGLLKAGDMVVDGGNSDHRNAKGHEATLGEVGVAFVDCGTSGGVWGLTEGYCLMLGGPEAAIAHLRPALDALAPPKGWKHVGGTGAGHFTKMVHNGIEYALMEAYAEGFELLQASPHGLDLAEIADLWGQGSVVRSWLLGLAAKALNEDPGLAHTAGVVADSGMGRWTVEAGLELGVPLPAISLALQMRQRSRQPERFADKVNAALRHQFGGHAIVAKEG